MAKGFPCLTKKDMNDRLLRHFGRSLVEVYAEPIARLTGWDLLEWTAQDEVARLRLTPRAYLLGIVVFREFMGYLGRKGTCHLFITIPFCGGFCGARS